MSSTTSHARTESAHGRRSQVELLDQRDVGIPATLEGGTHVGSTGTPLPLHLLSRVLQFVDASARLGSCALVSHSWRTAAAAATSSMQLMLRRKQKSRAAALQQWLHSDSKAANVLLIDIKYRTLMNAGEEFQRFIVQGEGDDEEEDEDAGEQYRPLQLPFQQLRRLQSLRLSNFSLQPPQDPATASTAAAGSISRASNPFTCAPSSLVKLCLQPADLSAFPGGYRSLSALTGLQQLEVGLDPQYSRDDEEGGVGSVRRTDMECHSQLAAGLGQLSQLTSLKLYCFKYESTVPAAITALQQLQDLRLLRWEMCGHQSSVFVQLPTTLTSLDVQVVNFGICKNSGTSSHTPHVSHLTALQHLSMKHDRECSKHMWWCSPGWLGELCCLKRLSSVALDISMDSSIFLALVQTLGQLKQLQHVQLHSLVQQFNLARLSPDACAALFSIPQITHLVLEDVALQPGGMTAVSERVMLDAEPGVHALRALSLHLSSSRVIDCEMRDMLKGFERFKPEDLPSLVRCFPQLQQLDIVHCLPDDCGGNLTAVMQLTGLTRLSVGGSCLLVTDDAAVNVLARLTGLKHLELQGCEGLTVWGLLALTRLTGLTRLRPLPLADYGCMSNLGDDCPNLPRNASMFTSGWSSECVHNSFLNYQKSEGLTSTACPPDVWQQLLQFCQLNKHYPELAQAKLLQLAVISRLYHCGSSHASLALWYLYLRLSEGKQLKVHQEVAGVLAACRERKKEAALRRSRLCDSSGRWGAFAKGCGEPPGSLG